MTPVQGELVTIRAFALGDIPEGVEGDADGEEGDDDPNMGDGDDGEHTIRACLNSKRRHLQFP